MCTLTYIPKPKGYIITHNRDERNNRASSITFCKANKEKQTLYFPQDLEAKGSWMAFSTSGRSACILNGGSKPYTRKNSYRKSRGLVVLESFNFDTPQTFYNTYDFSDIEPFTLILSTSKSLFQIIHNENDIVLKELNANQNHIWSSTTLYSPKNIAKRKNWFEKWLQQKPILDKDNLLHFHQNTGDGDIENDLMMSRWGILQTVSITQIDFQNNTAHLYYQNFMENTVDKQTISS